MQLDGGPLASPAPPLNELLRAGLDAAPDDIAMVSIARSMTWRELDRASAALAGGYRRLGLQAGRPDRLADAQPDRPRRPLPGLLQGGAGGDAAELPLHASRDRPRARGQRAPGAAGPRRARRGLAASALAREPGLRGDRLPSDPEVDRAASDGWAHELRALLAAPPLSCDADARSVESRGDLLHLGKHRAGQGRHPHAGVAALDDRQRRVGVRARRRRGSCRAPRCRTSARFYGR